LPIGLGLLGRAFSEAELLRLGSAYERQVGWSRRLPASTPPLVDGPVSPAAVAPTSFKPSGPTAIDALFSRTATEGVIAYRVSVTGIAPADLVAVALHRAMGGANGPAIARLLRKGEIIGSGEITLRDPDRAALAAGGLYVELYTREQPLGAGRRVVTVK
jgi:hypothetical protein